MQDGRREFLKYMAALGIGSVLGITGSGWSRAEAKVNPNARLNIFLEREPYLSFSDGSRRLEYPVVAGREGYNTPKGDFLIKEAEHKPMWIPPVVHDEKGFPLRDSKGNFVYSKWVSSNTGLLEYLNYEAPTDKETGLKYVPFDSGFHALGPYKMKLYYLDGNPSSILVHGHGDEAIEKRIWYDSHGCVRTRDRDIGEMGPYVQESLDMGYIPVSIV